MNTKIIDIGEFIKEDTALVGESNGRELLKDIGLDLETLERTTSKIVILIPDKIISVNKSYITGLFGERIQDLQKGFLDKYEFKAAPYAKGKILRDIERILGN